MPAKGRSHMMQGKAIPEKISNIRFEFLL